MRCFRSLWRTLSAVVFIATSACAATPTQEGLSPDISQERTPAAEILAPNSSSERELQDILQAPDAAYRISRYLHLVTAIFFRAEQYLEEFDAELAKVVAQPDLYPAHYMMTHSSYAHLLAARIFTEEARGQVTFLYLRLMEIENTPTDGSAEAITRQQRAKAARQALLAAVEDNNSGVNRIALQGLYADLAQAAELYSMDHKVSLPERLTFRAMVIQDSLKIQALMKSLRKQMTVETRSAKLNGAQEASLEESALLIQTELQENYEQRAPNAVAAIGAPVVAAAIGPLGNLTGMNFAPGRWALTFDDGPHVQYTPMVLDNLSKHGLRATFFWLAMNTQRLTGLVARAKGMGMVLGNHSYTHANLPKLNAAGLQHEINDSNQVDITKAGFTPAFFRCPYGACGAGNSVIRQMIAKLGLIHVLWNVDSLDWQDHNPTSVLQRVQKQMSAMHHGIILFHDIHPQSVEASRMLMDQMVVDQKAGKLRELTIQQAVDELNSAQGMQ
jgi:peptidoglycan/xylan/chitin deacetylase (PgdA/CDA1 family)